MLTFRNVNIFFACLLIILTGIDILYDLSPLVSLYLVIPYSLLLFYGCYYIHSGFFMKIVCAAKTSKKEIAISFDDGPAENFTPGILAALRTAGVQASFFCIGKRIEGNEHLIKQINDDHHLVCNHSFSHHFLFDLFSSRRMLHELKLTDKAIQRITGMRPKLFRPPYGVMNPNLRKAILDGKYIPVGWSVRSMDTVIKDEKKLFTKITRALQPGAVYLFHDTSASTLGVLSSFIKEAHTQGYEIVRLDKMLALQPYA